MKPSSSPQLLRQLLSFDYPKLSLVKCDDDNEGSIRTSSSLRRGGVSSKCEAEKRTARMTTTSASPCVICSTQFQDKDDQLIFIFCSEGHHRPLLTSLLGGSCSTDEDGWPLCPSCLSVVRRLTGLMDEVEDIKTRIKAVIKLAMTTEGSTSVEKRKGRPPATHVHGTTSVIANPLSFYPLQDVGDDDDDDHPMSAQDNPMKDHDEVDDNEDTISETFTCFKHEAMIEGDGDHYEDKPLSTTLVITEPEINEGHHYYDPSSLSAGDPTKTVRILRSHSLSMLEEGREASGSGSNFPPLLNNGDRVRSRRLRGPCSLVYPCPLCPNKTFHTSAEYKRHRKRVHNNQRTSSPCYFCQRTFTCAEYLIRHVRIHTLERPFLCSDCGKDFTSSVCLKQHECPKNASVYPPRPRWQCHLCGTTFKHSNALGHHTKRAHKATKMDFQPSPGATAYPCPECGKTFAKKDYLTSHLQGVHLLDPSKKQNCPICPTRFYCEHVFLAHTHPDPKDPCNVLYICSICRKTFDGMRNYRRHWTRVHNRRDKNKRFQCHHCGKLFQSVANMNFHSESCSVSPKEQRTCAVASCGQVFATLFERLNHERVVHKGLPSTKCYFCSKTFRFTATLEDHVRIHSRERPFRCLKCGKDFRIPENLRTHVARVCGGDERKKEEARKRKREHQRAFRAKLKYPCDLCYKRFGQKPQLVGHKKRDHFV